MKDLIPVKEFQKDLSRLLKFVSSVDGLWPNLYNPRLEPYNRIANDYRGAGFGKLLSQEYSR